MKTHMEKMISIIFFFLIKKKSQATDCYLNVCGARCLSIVKKQKKLKKT